jgi:hypothetical protein
MKTTTGDKLAKSLAIPLGDGMTPGAMEKRVVYI